MFERTRNWAVGSDPGLMRLRMATRTTAALATALVVLFGLTKATGQPLTVALLGALITMVSARSVNEPDPHKQHVTMALLPLPTAASITAAALVTPYPVVGDVVFVVVVFVAVYVRRFGPRGTTLGMVTFMAYFFSLYLRAELSELPWLIGATVVGTLCSFVWSAYLMPDKPESVLRENIRSLRARMAIVVDRTADLVRNSRTDDRSLRRLRIRVVRLNETALTVQAQIEERVNPGALWPGVSGEDLAMWLFDAELTVERLATAGARAAEADLDNAARTELANTVAMLSRAIRLPLSHRLRETAERAQRLLDASPDELPVSRLALAVVDTAKATAEVRKRIESVESDTTPASEPDRPEKQVHGGMLPSTRQAVQVAVAAALAIIVGEIVSPSHWYWAAIAAFVIFAGTNTWAETLDKGWQRLLGTVLGVPSGVLVATLVSGNKIASLLMIFVCLFCAFYFMKVTYSLMTFWISTMLALMYGLLGEFTFSLLVLRIEETAVGAVIGIAAAMLVLPINTRTHIRHDAHTFFLTLVDLIDESVDSLLGTAPATPLTETARQLGRDLQQFRTTAKPLSAGIAGLGGRRTMRHGLRMLNACDRYARILARSSATRVDTSLELAESIRATAAQIRRNIDVLITSLEFDQPATVFPSTDYIDAAESLARQHSEESLERRRLLSALHSLRQIDRVVINSAIDLGADNGVLLPH